MKIVKTILLILVGIIIALFVIQNMELVSLSFLTWNMQIPLAFASLILYVLGAITGGIVYSMLRKLSGKR